MNKLKKFVSTTLIGGFVVLLPLAILVLLGKFLVGIINRFLEPLASLVQQMLGLELSYLAYNIIALVIVINIFFFLGLIVRTSIGKHFFEGFERRTLSKIPMYKCY